MTTQIAIRLPDELVEFVDSMVRRGVVTSRAAFIARLLEREHRREQALEDVEIIKRVGPDPELNAIAKWQAENFPEID
jgi:Arc/MetJ-type ribon-helix-helix transcriptional regulator